MTASPYAEFKELQTAVRDQVLRITLSNPPMNGMTPAIHGELAYIFRVANRDRSIRAVVITGAGDRAFSAGGDINRMAAKIDDHGAWNGAMPEAREIIASILECDKPTIARINGHAVGLGASIVLACDITVMVEKAKIGDTHVKVGLSAGDGGALLWPFLVGPVLARRYLLTGDLLTGAEAAAIGLITEAVPAADLDVRVDMWTERLARGATQAISLTKRSINANIRQQAQAYLDAHLGLETMTHLSADHRRAAFAFRDQEEASFEGD